jgi:hypothetical protein
VTTTKLYDRESDSEGRKPSKHEPAFNFLTGASERDDSSARAQHEEEEERVASKGEKGQGNTS